MATTTEQVYQNWMGVMGLCTVTLFNVGKELAGETFVKRLEEEFYKVGLAEGGKLRDKAGLGKDETDCIAIGKMLDIGDESMGNYWDEHVENSPKVFEKHINTCPVGEILSHAPEMCSRVIAATVQGTVHCVNSNAKVSWHEIIARGDKTCHYRVQI